MPKILHTARYTGIPWQILKEAVPAGFAVETLEELNSECLKRQAGDAVDNIVAFEQGRSAEIESKKLW